MKKLKPFVKLAKRVDSPKEFIDKAREFKDVPYEVSEWFANTYGAGTMLSIEKATEHFMEDVDKGKYERISNPYLYKREEIRM